MFEGFQGVEHRAFKLIVEMAGFLAANFIAKNYLCRTSHRNDPQSVGRVAKLIIELKAVIVMVYM